MSLKGKTPDNFRSFYPHQKPVEDGHRFLLEKFVSFIKGGKSNEVYLNRVHDVSFQLFKKSKSFFSNVALNEHSLN